MNRTPLVSGATLCTLSHNYYPNNALDVNKASKNTLTY